MRSDITPIPIRRKRKVIAPMSSSVICSRSPHHQTFWFSPTAYTDKSYTLHSRYRYRLCHNGIVYKALRPFLCCAYSCNRPYLHSFAYTFPTTLFRLKCPTSVIARLNPYFRLCRSAYTVSECYVTFRKMYSFWIFDFLEVNTIFASHNGYPAQYHSDNIKVIRNAMLSSMMYVRSLTLRVRVQAEEVCRLFRT